MSNKVYQIVTDRIIEALDRGVVPWHKPWKGGHSLPHNMFSMDPEKGRYYQGANVGLLWISGFTDARWMTYSQAKKNGITIKDGEKPSPVIFWKFLDKKDENDNVIDKIPLLRYFKVYNAEQCENAPKLPVIPVVDPTENFENCEVMMNMYGVNLVHRVVLTLSMTPTGTPSVYQNQASLRIWSLTGLRCCTKLLAAQPTKIV
jgi:antirestriction protein ArdC